MKTCEQEREGHIQEDETVYQHIWNEESEGERIKIEAMKVSKRQIRQILKDVICTLRAIRRHCRILSKTRI